MDYRMYSGGADAGKDVVALIKESLKEQNMEFPRIFENVL